MTDLTGWRVLAEKCAECSIDPELFLREKLFKLEERKRILLTPPKRWFTENYTKYEDFACRVLRRGLNEHESYGPDRLSELIRRRYYPEARQQVDEATKRKLLEETHGRCAVCGTRLALVEAYIDHKVPLAEGGSSHSLNLQPLCKMCNEGKSDYFTHAAQASARPWWQPRQSLIRGVARLTATVRFCVLTRDNSACINCGVTAREISLYITPRVNPEEGGQLVYDNLITLCDKCK